MLWDFCTLLHKGFGLRKIRKKRGKRTRNIMRREKTSARCYTQDSHYLGVDFFNFQPARLGSLQSKSPHSLFLTSVVTVGPSLFLTSVVTSWPSLANIAKLMENAESCLGDYQGYHRSKVYCS